MITLKEAPWGHCDHITGQFLKELSMSGSGTCWIHCEEHCERNPYVSHWGHCDHIDGHIVKELNLCPRGTLWSHHWVHCECDQHVPTGHIVIKLMGTL